MLVKSGLVSAANVDRALAAQTHQHVRIGTLLRNAGVATGEVITRMLARQLGVPAALARHLESMDARLAAQLPPGFGRANFVVPLLPAADGTIVICVRDPGTPGLLESLQQFIPGKLVLAVALEGALQPIVDQIYSADDDVDIDMGMDWDQGGLGTVPTESFDGPVEGDVYASGKFELTTLDDSSISRSAIEVEGKSATPPSQRAAPNAAASILNSPTPVAIAPPAASVPAAPAVVRPRERMNTLSPESADALLAQTSERDAVNAIVLDVARRFADSAVFLAVKDGVALGHDGFGGTLDGAVSAIALPLTLPSTVREVIERQTDYLGPRPKGGNLVWTRLLGLLGSSPIISVHRIMVGTRPVAILITAVPQADTTISKTLTNVCLAAGEAYARILRDRKKKP